MAEIKGQGIGYNQQISQTQQGIKQVGLNNSEPAEFLGSNDFGSKQPAEDVLDKLNDQCKLIGKNYGFKFPEDDGLYVTEYLNGRKPCEYEHVKLTTCKVKELAFGDLQGEDRDVNVCNYSIDFGIDTTQGVIIRSITYNDGVPGIFYGYYTTNVLGFLRDNGFGEFNGGPTIYTLSLGLVEILSIEFDYFDLLGANIIANATITKTGCTLQRLKGRQNNGFYVMHYNYNNGDRCDYQLKKMDKIIRGRRISEEQQIFDTAGGSGNHEFDVMFDSYITDYQPLVATPSRFIIPRDSWYSMRIKANVYANNIHAVRLFIKNFTTGEYYLLDPRKSGQTSTFNPSGTLNDLRLQQQTPQTDSNGDTEPLLYQMKRMSENHGFPVSLDYMTDPGMTLFEMDELPMKAGHELGVIIRIAGTNDNTLPGKTIISGQKAFNPPIVGDGGTKRFIKSEPDYGLFN